MKTPHYDPHPQLDMFAPVQLGFGIDPVAPRHLTEAEADALATVIVRKFGYAPQGIELINAMHPYNLDAASRELVHDCMPF